MDKYNLFNHYSRDMANIQGLFHMPLTGEIEEPYMACPLCHACFIKGDIDQGDLTLEHVPPQSLGGKGILLTCKECNNNYGSSLDAPLLEIIGAKDALSGRGDDRVSGELQVDGKRIAIEFRKNRGNVGEFYVIPKATDSRNIAAMYNRFNSVSRPVEISFQLKSLRSTMSLVALLRHAFLYGFTHFGYSFLVNPNIEKVLQQIKQPMAEFFPLSAIKFDVDLPDDCLGINIVTNSESRQCLGVCFDITKNKNSNYRVIVLFPGPAPEDWTQFGTFTEEKAKLRFGMYTINHEAKLKQVPLFHHFWLSEASTGKSTQ